MLELFSRLGREQAMQALVDYANRFPELPDRFAAIAAGEEHKVHECMTPVALFHEVEDGTIRFYADVPRNAPTITLTRVPSSSTTSGMSAPWMSW